MWKVCFCHCPFHLVLILISGTFRVTLATTIKELTPTLYFCMTSSKYSAKKERNVDLPFRCHLSSVMPDSIFYDSLWWDNLFLFFNNNGHGKPLSYNGVSGMALISFQYSGVCPRISELWFHGWVLLLFSITLLFTRLSNTTYLIGLCDMISIQPWVKVV